MDLSKPSQKTEEWNFQISYYGAYDCCESYTDPDDYDMMEVVILNLGDEESAGEQKILNLLNILFSPTISPEIKKQKLQDEYDIAMTEELESGVKTMCNLSEGLIEMGIEQEKMKLVQLMLEEGEEIDKIQKYTGYSIQKLKEIEKSMEE